MILTHDRYHDHHPTGQTRLEHKSFKTPTKRTVEVTILASAYHQEINAAEAGSADRFVVQEVIKEIAQSYNPAAAMGGGSR